MDKKPRRSAEMRPPSALASGDEEDAPDTHTYTLCLLGDWPQADPMVKPRSSLLRGDTQPPTVYEVDVELESKIVQASCGSGWFCLLCEDGRAFSCGDNSYGQLAQAHGTPHVSFPAPIATPFSLLPRRRITRISCGSAHGGFVLDSGELYMYGCGTYGRLGTGSEANVNTPTRVELNWTTLVAAASPDTSNRKPQESSGDYGSDGDDVQFTDISCGDRHTLVLGSRRLDKNGNSIDGRRRTIAARGGVIAFGDGMNGRLGLGDEKDRREGVLVTTWLTDASDGIDGALDGGSRFISPPCIIAICAGATHNLALTASGEVFSWGNGVDGQLGHGRRESEWSPRQVAFFKHLPVSSVSCGTSHSLAVSRTGVVYAWGRGAEGQLGSGVDTMASKTEDSMIDISKSVGTPQPVGLLRGTSQRAAARTITANQHVCLVLDDRERLFVWGDNTLGQLGIERAAAANTTTRSSCTISRPKQLSYMDLHASTTVLPSSSPLSRTKSVREHVAAAKAEFMRLGLAHCVAGDRFTLLVFSTKPATSTGSRRRSSANGEAREYYRQASFSSSTSPSNAVLYKTTLPGLAPSGDKWNFLPAGELPESAIPSREPAFYDFMVNYKVHIRNSSPQPLDEEEADGYTDAYGDDYTERRSSGTSTRIPSDQERDQQLQAARRRERRRQAVSTAGTLQLSVDFMTIANRSRGGSSSRDRNDSSAKEPAVPVNGFDAWLSKRSNSPVRSAMEGHSFSVATRFPQQLRKEDETREPTTSSSRNTASGLGRRSEADFAANRPRPPQQPKSVFGRTISTRRPSVLTFKTPSKPSAIPPSAQKQLPSQKSNQESDKSGTPSTPATRSSRAATPWAPFGSSTASRFAPQQLELPPATTIYPEKCTVRLRRAPQFSLGGAEHFSLVISRRLQHAKGPGPGPGTYDRHGG